MTEYLFEAVSADNIRLLNHFLKQHKEQSANRGDLNFWLKQNGKVIAVARLVRVENDSTKELWLRGLFVVESHRKQGLGHQLMLQIHAHMQQEFAIPSTKKNQNQQTLIPPCGVCPFFIYAFPHGHLSRFYCQLGYKDCEPNELPESLKTRYLNAKTANKDWLCMVKIYSEE